MNSQGEWWEKPLDPNGSYHVNEHGSICHGISNYQRELDDLIARLKANEQYMNDENANVHLYAGTCRDVISRLIALLEDDEE